MTKAAKFREVMVRIKVTKAKARLPKASVANYDKFSDAICELYKLIDISSIEEIEGVFKGR